uniref:Sperm-associated antigen 16 protein n=1 Tax=Denticeps clupeoides TaxID=299321 RepID=A0AAY4E8U6_9TELE
TWRQRALPLRDMAADGPCFLERVSLTDSDSDDGFQYEEVSAEDDVSASAGDEDLHAALDALERRADGDARARASPRPPPPHAPEPIDDFLRNFLVRTGLARTLDCFQTEWFELQRKGLLPERPTACVPDAYVHNRLLEVQLRRAEKERDAYKQAALRAGELVLKLQKERDFHRLQHRRAAQEKSRLAEDVRRLKERHAACGPALRQLAEKHRASLRQKALVGLERDRALNRAARAESPDRGDAVGPGKEPEPGKEPTKEPTKEPGKNKALRHLKDSEFPACSRTKPLPPRAHGAAVSGLALHPRKMVAASSGDDRLWRLWGVPAGEMVLTGQGHADWLSGCCFHPGGGALATTGGDATVKVWDLVRGRCVLTFEGHAHATWGCSFHSGGDFLASCSMDNTAKVWDLNSQRCRATLRGHADSVNSVAFLPSSNTVLTCSADKTVSLWDARAARCAQTFYGHRHSCNHAAFSARGDVIASCDSYGTVMLWDARKASAVATVDTGPHPGNQLAFGPSGESLAVASNDGAVKLVRLATLQVSSLLGHEDAVQSVTFDHREDYLLSGGADGAIIIWSRTGPDLH